MLSPRALVRGNPARAKFAAENMARFIVGSHVGIYHITYDDDNNITDVVNKSDCHHSRVQETVDIVNVSGWILLKIACCDDTRSLFG